ncbi:RNA ligase [Balamuthia mandrillaris]
MEATSDSVKEAEEQPVENEKDAVGQMLAETMEEGVDEAEAGEQATHESRDEIKNKYSKEVRHHKYPSIEHPNRPLVMEQIIHSELLMSRTWVITEKVHGANFAFITDGADIKCAKRSGLLKEEEDFYCWPQVLQKHEPFIRSAFAFLKERIQFDVLTIYGELFGGMYPHEDVPKVEGVKHVQKGVYYCPTVEFYAFDVHVTNPDGNRYLSVDFALEVFQTAQFPFYAEPLARGTFHELLKFDVEQFHSTIPAKLGLPLLPENIAEGVVLRPALSEQFGCWPCLKLKSERFHEVTTGKNAGKRIPKPPKPGTPARKQTSEEQLHTLNDDQELGPLANKLIAYINENRLRSVLSKMGRAKEQHFRKVSGLLVQDALIDFKKDEDEFDKLLSGGAEERKEKKGRLVQMVSTAAAEVVVAHWDDIIKGEF